MKDSCVVIGQTPGQRHFHLCIGAKCQVKNPDEPIPQFYSDKHASDVGWRRSASHPDGGWLCPICADTQPEKGDG